MTTSFDLPTATDLRKIADRLLARLRSLDSVAVGFSGGVDSTLVLAAALRALPANRVVAVIADSPSLARTELIDARQVAADLGAELVEVRVAELDVPGYRANAGDRCYFCKHTVLSAVSELAVQRGIAHVATGTHADDRRAVHRPGLRAARELHVVEPLADAGLGKAEIRMLAAAWSLPVADKPATPCLASRIAVGVPAPSVGWAWWSAPRSRCERGWPEPVSNRVIYEFGCSVTDLPLSWTGRRTLRWRRRQDSPPRSSLK